jgi:acetyl/propionyl-CoA carboxylase alpha subunit
MRLSLSDRRKPGNPTWTPVRILEAARVTGAQAVHPGYGFLSEDAGFAGAVGAAGLVFIGPSPPAIHAMGDKAEARARMQTAGVPLIPGYQGLDREAEFLKAAAEIGYPVLVKAAAGGGGKGMRVVAEESGLKEALSAARREAQHAFGSDRLILERYIPQAHHVEIQVLGDQHGTLLHCSSGNAQCSAATRKSSRRRPHR